MSRLEQIAYELKNLWKYLTRNEICEYFNITDRTLYNYQKKLNLPKNESIEMKVSKPITVYMNTEDNKLRKQVFKNYKHFVVWSKAQSHPFKIIDQNSISIDYTRVTPEAKEYMQLLRSK